jgi:hypothetical protein
MLSGIGDDVNPTRATAGAPFGAGAVRPVAAARAGGTGMLESGT